MNQTVVGYFDDFDDADAAIGDLERSGFAMGEIGIVTLERRQGATIDTSTGDAAPAGDIGAGKGAFVGGVTGLLIGLGALLIPGVGPVVAAGPLAAALTAGLGAVSGAVAAPLLDGLMGAGIPEDEARAYMEGIRRGGTLVTVECGDERIAEVRSIFEENKASDIREHARRWEEEGWQQAPTVESTESRDFAVTTDGIEKRSEANRFLRTLEQGKVHDPLEISIPTTAEDDVVEVTVTDEEFVAAQSPSVRSPVRIYPSKRDG